MIERRSLRHRPAPKRASVIEAEVPVRAGAMRPVLLKDELRRTGPRCGIAGRRLRGDREIALRAIRLDRMVPRTGFVGHRRHCDRSAGGLSRDGAEAMAGKQVASARRHFRDRAALVRLHSLGHDNRLTVLIISPKGAHLPSMRDDGSTGAPWHTLSRETAPLSKSSGQARKRVRSSAMADRRRMLSHNLRTQPNTAAPINATSRGDGRSASA
jgi:hypothetical protein